MAHEILIVDDEADIRSLISDILQDEGYTTHLASDGAGAIEMIKSRRPSLVILDIWLNDSRFDGIELLDVVKKDHPLVPVIMISGHGTIEAAVKALQKGAYDFIEKPFTAERLLLVIKHALESSELKRQNQDLRNRIFESEEFIGNSQISQQIRSTIGKVALTNSRVVITGPSGSGKELIARLIHKNSRRAAGPFIVFDCRGHTPASFEEALLGKEGDRANPLLPSKVGILEEAHNGTLFLSHLSEIPEESQSKLVRILHDLTFERLGGNKKIKVDIRIIGSTVDDVESLVKAGQFKEDLFYRLSVVGIKVPPLTQRPEDIILLLEYFMKKLSPISKKRSVRQFTEDAKGRLQTYSWPGNVRQIRNVAEWILLVVPEDSEAPIGAEILPPEITTGAPSILSLEGGEELLKLPLRDAREVFERQYLASQIVRFGGNISKTAEFVEMERSALHRKLRSLGIGGDRSSYDKKDQEEEESTENGVSFSKKVIG